MRVFLIASYLVLVAIATAQWRSYEGHKVLRVFPRDGHDATFLESLREQALMKLDFWERPNTHGAGVAVHVSPEMEAAFQGILESRGINYETSVPDLQQLIDEEMRSNEEAKRAAAGSIVGTFARPAEISAWMSDLVENSPIASLFSIGKSYEGRSLDVIKISSGGEGKQGIWVDAGIHAREWLSQATLVWMINEMVNNYETDANIKAMVDKYDFYLMPMMNPDGYEYSHNSDRMWRKTRSRNANNLCIGVDANRNFDYPKFGGASTSSVSCSDLYKGPHAFSEPESRALKEFILDMKGQIEMYIAVHAYSQMWFTPWGYSDDNIRPEDAREMDRVANIGANALYNVHQTRFQVGTSPELLYAAAGAAEDWAKGFGGVKYAYCFELRPGPNSRNGFVVKASEIGPSGQEVLAGVLAAAAALQ